MGTHPRGAHEPSEETINGFWSIAGWTSLIWAVFVGCILAGRWFCNAIGGSLVIKIASAGILPAIVAIFVTIVIENNLGGSWQSLGLRPAGYRNLLLGIVAGTPILIAYYVIFGILGVNHSTVPLVGLVVLKFFIAQGVAEEVIFRGFVFRRLRAGRTFLRSATLSAMVFALVHLSNFLNGLTMHVAIGVIISVLFAFVLAYPAALLFERSGRTIWPFAITHVMIDSVNWFEHVSLPGLGLYVYLGAVMLTVGWTIVLSVRFATERNELTGEKTSAESGAR